jgi:hypothetical protein
VSIADHESDEVEELLRKVEEKFRNRFGDEVSPAQIMLDACTPRLYVSFGDPGEAKFGPYISVEFSKNRLYANVDDPERPLVLAEFNGESWTVLGNDTYKFVTFHTFGHEEKDKKEPGSRKPSDP